MSDSLRARGLQPTRLLCPWDSPGKNTRVGCHFLLQGAFLTQGSNSGLLHSEQILYHVSHSHTTLEDVTKELGKEKWSRSVVSDSLQSYGLQPTRILHPWDFPGKSPGVGCHFILQGILPIQGLNPGLPYCRQLLYSLIHQGSPKQLGGHCLMDHTTNNLILHVFIPFLQSPFQTLSCLGLLHDLPFPQHHRVLPLSSFSPKVSPPLSKVTQLPAAYAPKRASQSISTSREDKELLLIGSILFKRQFEL